MSGVLIGQWFASAGHDDDGAGSNWGKNFLHANHGFFEGFTGVDTISLAIICKCVADCGLG